MNRYGGCFAPQSPVKMFDGSTCEIHSLRRGMRVWGGAFVQYVLKMSYSAVMPMVTLEAVSGAFHCSSVLTNPSHPPPGAVLVTPWHPVVFAGEWTFPCSIRRPSFVYVDSVYSVVLSTDHVIDINGLQFITLGHGIENHRVLSHAFFGTQVLCCELTPHC
jgi:hypothetical protein